ncbi:Mpo1-like protein [Tahibacter amnicola]|uniref:DUF962 domain-containing protein n=1 Tax=Tahibacter amnicola TaxID=2976241 RepID=A0ABY6BA05_9GAMM|nr:Mpo1-like protein [Tahibacter amnicola]UXI66690.1 DUF962 domain-containing protein [Tahibacter amnicola]
MAREGGLIRWQWQGYDRNHRDRLNLVLHMLAVPAFIAGVLAAVTSLVHGQWLAAGVSVVVAVAAFAVQGVGHKREAEAPIPFDGPADFIGRVLIEQFITFPRFVLSGGWLNNLISADSNSRNRHG